MDLTVVILNWNAASDTVRCVRGIGGWQQLQPAIIVVDNASEDNSVELITRECPQVHLIRNRTNQGFAGGSNRGIEAALGMGNAPVLLLNNDAAVSEAGVVRLLETLQADEKIGFVGPVLFDGNDKDKLLSAGSKDPSLHHHSHNHHWPKNGPVAVVQCIPGTVILIRPDVFRTVGLLDEAYFFGSEVADLCLLARQHGYLSVIDTRARAWHRLERSSEFRQTLYPYYIIRNRFLLIRKLHRPWKLFFYSFWTSYSLLLATKVQLSGQPAMARAIRLGLRDGLQGRFGNQNERVLALAAVTAS